MNGSARPAVDAWAVIVDPGCAITRRWPVRAAGSPLERALFATANVEMNRPAAEAGLSVLEAGGDFADGVIAYEGSWLGGETFVSFDKKAVGLLSAQGQAVRLL